jgi:syntaxin 7
VFKGLAQEFRQKMAAHPARESSAAQKLLRDFQSLLKNSERLMETAKAKEAASLPRQQAGVAAAAAAAQQQEQSTAARQAAEQQALLEAQRKQELLSVENQLQFNDAVIEERDQAITQIAGQIGEVGTLGAAGAAALPVSQTRGLAQRLRVRSVSKF